MDDPGRLLVYSGETLDKRANVCYNIFRRIEREGMGAGSRSLALARPQLSTLVVALSERFGDAFYSPNRNALPSPRQAVRRGPQPI